MRPTTGRIVRYRGRDGRQAVRAAIVTADVETLTPDGVDAGEVPPLDSDRHVHLWVFTPSALGGFPEFNIGPGAGAGAGAGPGQWHWPVYS